MVHHITLYLADLPYIFFFWDCMQCSIQKTVFLQGMDEGNLRIEDEEEIISAITHTLCSVLDKELKKSSLAKLLCSSYSAVEKIVCTLSLVQPFCIVIW